MLAMCMVSLASAQDIYRWVDANGVVQYSDRPPPDAQAAEVTVPTRNSTTPEAPTADATATTAEQTGGEKTTDAPSEPRLTPEQQAEIARVRAENCKRGRSNLRYLETNPPVRLLVKQDDGSVARMTEEGHARRMASARQMIAENCSN